MANRSFWISHDESWRDEQIGTMLESLPLSINSWRYDSIKRKKRLWTCMLSYCPISRPLRRNCRWFHLQRRDIKDLDMRVPFPASGRGLTIWTELLISAAVASSEGAESVHWDAIQKSFFGCASWQANIWLPSMPETRLANMVPQLWDLVPRAPKRPATPIIRVKTPKLYIAHRVLIRKLWTRLTDLNKPNCPISNSFENILGKQERFTPISFFACIFQCNWYLSIANFTGRFFSRQGLSNEQ